MYKTDNSLTRPVLCYPPHRLDIYHLQQLSHA